MARSIEVKLSLRSGYEEFDSISFRVGFTNDGVVEDLYKYACGVAEQLEQNLRRTADAGPCAGTP